MEEALYEITPLHHFARLRLTGAIADETTILNFRGCWRSTIWPRGSWKWSMAI